MANKLLKIIVVFALGFFVSSHKSQVFAADCSALGVGVTISPTSIIEGDGTTAITVGVDTTYLPEDNYRIMNYDDMASTIPEESTGFQARTSSTTNLTFSLSNQLSLTGDDIGSYSSDTQHIYLYKESQYTDFCYVGSYTITKNSFVCTQPVIVSQTRAATDETGATTQTECFYNDSTSCLDSQSPITFSVAGLVRERPDTAIQSDFGGSSLYTRTRNATGANAVSWSIQMNPDNYTLVIRDYFDTLATYTGQNCGGFDIEVKPSCPPTECEEQVTNAPITLGPDVFSLCDQIADEQSEEKAACIACTGGSTEAGSSDAEGVWTAIGCIQKDPQAIISKFINVGLGIGGGVALITFLAAGFIYSTSQGSPEKVKNAKEMMTASIIGLLFIIFSVTILQFIGWTILKIPGFGG